MKAALWTKYGSPEVLEYREVEKPVPRDTEVLIKVFASTVTAGDCELRSLTFPWYLAIPIRLFAGITKPERIKILGQEISGEVEATGKDIKIFSPGDQVFGATGFTMGANAEYISLPEKSVDSVITIKPANMRHEEAATIPLGGLEALHFLRTANIKKGQKVLINGAGGSIGTIGIQIAKSLGAEVTAVDRSDKLEIMRSIGADYVIDFTIEDYTRQGKNYDVIFDVPGKGSFLKTVKILNTNGYYLIANPRPLKMILGFWISLTSRKRVILESTERKIEDLILLKEMCETGKIKAVIDRRYSLEQIVEAHQYVEDGNKKGNVVILPP
ncbi:MAG: NAD(P)-dependent alcohol dehydrogenase [Spirochaetales bacterium]|nr:NAD(P)-dependent alcohol dehydrogenase [Spirochaetales bacterium]